MRWREKGEGPREFNQVTQVTNYKGDPLNPKGLAGPGSSSTSAFFKAYGGMGAKVKVNNKSLTLKDVCEDCNKCEVSLYTGIKQKQPSTYEGFKHNSEYTLKKA